MRLLYAAGVHGHSDTFEKDIATHLQYGHVLDTPDYFMMWRMVDLSWPLEIMRTPEVVLPDSDCAWVWAISGNYRDACAAAMGICPEARWVGYDRRGKPWIGSIDRFMRNMAIGLTIE
jgi:hypothetical protein